MFWLLLTKIKWVNEEVLSVTRVGVLSICLKPLSVKIFNYFMVIFYKVVYIHVTHDNWSSIDCNVFDLKKLKFFDKCFEESAGL